MTTEEWPAEEWRAIDGYDGWYEISDRGRVRTWKERGARPLRRSDEPRLMGMWPKPKGHLNVVFTVAGRPRARTIHQLVAEAFIGPRPEGLETCHNDGDPTNNHVSNLRYDTPANNRADKYRHGTDRMGVKHPLAKLTEDNVRDIRSRRASGERAVALAEEFDMHVMSIYAITQRKSWAHVA